MGFPTSAVSPTKPTSTEVWRAERRQAHRKAMEDFLLGIFNKAYGLVTSAFLEDALLKQPKDFDKKEMWAILQDFENRNILRYEDTGAKAGYRYLLEKKVEDQPPPPAPPAPPPKVTRVPPAEPSKGPETFKPPVQTVTRNVHNTTDEDIVEFIKENVATTVDVAKWMNCSYPTAMSKLEGIKGKGTIIRRTPRGPWILNTGIGVRAAGAVERVEPEAIGLVKADPDPRDDVFEQRFDYKIHEDGSATFTGLLHHKKIVLPPEEVVKIVEALTASPVDHARRAMHFKLIAANAASTTV
jgi:hypothetical protein